MKRSRFFFFAGLAIFACAAQTSFASRIWEWSMRGYVSNRYGHSDPAHPGYPQKITPGCIISGGKMPILIRATGKSLNKQFGVMDALANVTDPVNGHASPTLDVYVPINGVQTDVWTQYYLAGYDPRLASDPNQPPDPSILHLYDPVAMNAEYDQDHVFKPMFADSEVGTVYVADPGQLSVWVGTNDWAEGEMLVELYDQSYLRHQETAAKFTNVSSRMMIHPDMPGSVIGGFIIGADAGGDGPRTIIFRVSGPALAQFGITDFAKNPTLELHDSSQMLSSNDDWQYYPTAHADSSSSAHVAIRAATASDMQKYTGFAFASGSKDAALIATLPPGAYTVIANSADGVGGTVLFELYDITDQLP